MKNSIKLTLLFAGGLIVGAVATFVILGQMSLMDYRNYYLSAAREQVLIASELRAKREQALQSRAEANLPEIVLAISRDERLQKTADAPVVLRQIRDFYAANSIPVPAEISSVLKDLPR
jgi:hypothetical protein